MSNAIDNALEAIRHANPVPDPIDLAESMLRSNVFLAATKETSMTDQPTNGTPAPGPPGRRKFLLALGGAFALAVIAVALVVTVNGGDDITQAATDDNPAVTTQPPATTAATTTEAPTTTQATTTTTQPATTTTTLPFIRTGTYAVPDEVAPGTYRHTLSAVRLDENMEIIDNYLVADPGTGIVIVQPTDSFVSVEGWWITVEDFGEPIDPIAKGLTSGVYVVGYDLEPGRYQVLPDIGPPPFWTRFDDEMAIIDSGTGDAPMEVIVEESDFAFGFSGILRRMP